MAPRRKNIFKSVLWILNILPRGPIALFDKIVQTFFDPFLDPPPANFWPNYGVIGVS